MRKRAKHLSRRIGQETRDGEKLVEWMLEIAKNKRHKDRLKALELLWNRYAGKATTPIELTGKDGQPLKVDNGNALDLTKLPSDQLDQLEKIYLAAAQSPGGAGGAGAKKSR